MKTKLLLIEDENNLRETIVEYLHLCNYDVTDTESPKDAFKLINENDFDIVLSDVNLPEMSGFDLLRKLKIEAVKPLPSFIFVSAMTEPTNIAEGLNMGANGYITKPFDMDNLIDKIEETLNKSVTPQ